MVQISKNQNTIECVARLFWHLYHFQTSLDYDELAQRYFIIGREKSTVKIRLPLLIFTHEEIAIVSYKMWNEAFKLYKINLEIDRD